MPDATFAAPDLTTFARLDELGLEVVAAIVDRLTFGGNILETGTDSYRLAHTHAQLNQHAAASD